VSNNHGIETVHVILNLKTFHKLFILHPLIVVHSVSEFKKD